MLVEINLLPHKKQKKLSFIVGLIILAVIFLLVSIIYFVQIHVTKSSIEAVSNQITRTQKLVELQSKQGTTASANSVAQLKAAIDWADKNRIETVPVMKTLTALLPERGFIQTFTYDEAGTVTILVQFDTAAEAAGYLNSLNNSSWIDNASLTSLNTSDNNTNSNSTSNTANTSTTSKVDSNTNKNVVPRYTGQFEIQFNKDAVQKAIQSSMKTGSDGEGGIGS